jgi:hypothetical protein
MEYRSLIVEHLRFLADLFLRLDSFRTLVDIMLLPDLLHMLAADIMLLLGRLHTLVVNIMFLLDLLHHSVVMEEAPVLLDSLLRSLLCRLSSRAPITLLTRMAVVVGGKS